MCSAERRKRRRRQTHFDDEEDKARQKGIQALIDTPNPHFPVYARVLHHHRMTTTTFALLPEADQVFMLGYALFRQRQIAEWRDTLIGEGGTESRLSPEAATTLFVEGL